MIKTITWLLQSDPYVRYRTCLDLLDQPEDQPEVKQARAEMLAQPQVRELVSEFDSWPGGVINNHKKANLLIHKLAFLAELGITVKDPGMEQIAESIMAHLSEQGVPEVMLNIPRAFGGTGEDMWAWTLCDTPRLCFSLKRMGVESETLEQGIETLASRFIPCGWPCACSPKMGRFKGPGKRTDPCPYANLLMISALLQAGSADRPELHTGAECLLGLWEHSRDQSPFLFHMGTDFRKLKAPFVWYDILHVADVLSQLPWLQSDPRMQDILHVILSKANEDGTYTPESVWMAWKAWDFGQKKMPAPWLTFLVLRILKRSGTDLSL